MARLELILTDRAARVRRTRARNALLGLLLIGGGVALVPTGVWTPGPATVSARLTSPSPGSRHDRSHAITRRLLAHVPAIYAYGAGNALVMGSADSVVVQSLLARGLVATVEPTHPAASSSDLPRPADTAFDLILGEMPRQGTSDADLRHARAFLETADGRLNPHGVLGIRIPIRGRSGSDMRLLLAMVMDVFPQTHVWQGDHRSLILVAGRDPLRFDYMNLQAAMAGRPGRDLAVAEIHDEAQLLNYFITDRSGLTEYVESANATAAWGAASPDQHPDLASNSGKPFTLLDLATVWRRPMDMAVNHEHVPGLAVEIDRYRKARYLTYRVTLGGELPAGESAAVDALELALMFAPDELQTREALGKLLLTEARMARDAGDPETAREFLDRAREVAPRGLRELAELHLDALAGAGLPNDPGAPAEPVKTAVLASAP